MSAPLGSVALDLDRQDAGAPRQQWIHLLPAPGLVQGRDGRSWRLGDLAQVIRASNSYAGGRGIPVDYEHQSEVAASNGQPAPAAGWIKELQSRADGLWGRVEWTTKAANHVQEREYRFVSPVFLYTQGDPGSITRLVSVGLTNGPNLLLKALNRARSGTAMDEMEELRDLLGLDDEAGIPEVLQGVRGLGHDLITG